MVMPPCRLCDGDVWPCLLMLSRAWWWCRLAGGCGWGQPASRGTARQEDHEAPAQDQERHAAHEKGRWLVLDFGALVICADVFACWSLIPAYSGRASAKKLIAWSRQLKLSYFFPFRLFSSFACVIIVFLKMLCFRAVFVLYPCLFERWLNYIWFRAQLLLRSGLLEIISEEKIVAFY